MRRILYITVLMLIASACTNTKRAGVTISVLEDTTEKNFIARPDSQTIFSKFGLEKDLWQTACFRYGIINSLVHNGRQEQCIEAENKLLGNTFERRQVIADFQEGLKAILETSKDSTLYQQSSIWLPLVEELQSLSHGKQRKVIFLFSDLRENSSWFSTYRNSDMKSFKENPDATVELFIEKSGNLSVSEGLRVVVVYQPRTVREDTIFRQMRALYTTLFLRLGIPISFSSNLNTEPL